MHALRCNVQRDKFKQIDDTFKRVIGILVNLHISTDILTRMARYPRQNTCLNVSVYYDFNDPLKRVVYVAEFFPVFMHIYLTRLFFSDNSFNNERIIHAILHIQYSIYGPICYIAL